MSVIETTLENFDADVLQASTSTPVVLDFWAPWCGPCQSLMPILEALADEYQGAFRLVKINIDEQSQLAQQYAVRSVPTVKIIVNTEVVDEFQGAIPESDIRTLLAKYIQTEADKRMFAALQNYQQGNSGALSEMQNLVDEYPENFQIRLQYITVLMMEQEYESAKTLLDNLPPQIKQNEDVAAMISRLEVMTIADKLGDPQALEQQIASHPEDCESRHQLSIIYIAQGQFEQALEQLYRIMKTDRSFKDDIGRKEMLKVFDMLGNSGELVSMYRKKLAASLY
jgi:putative thioredoxin